MQNVKTETGNRELFLTRIIDAPVDLVWEVFTKPEHIIQWWGPEGFTNTIHSMDVRPEGVWDFIMHGPDGTDYANRNIFKEIQKNRKIVYDHITEPRHLTTIRFEDQGDKTMVSMHMIFSTAAQLAEVVKKHKADEGLRQNLDKLNRYLTGSIKKLR